MRRQSTPLPASMSFSFVIVLFSVKNRIFRVAESPGFLENTEPLRSLFIRAPKTQKAPPMKKALLFYPIKSGLVETEAAGCKKTQANHTDQTERGRFRDGVVCGDIGERGSKPGFVE